MSDLPDLDALKARTKRGEFTKYELRAVVLALIERAKQAEEIVTASRLKERDLRHSLSVRSCHAQQDGDCSWDRCPQRRDGEPTATGRHCPLDNPANLDLEEWE